LAQTGIYCDPVGSHLLFTGGSPRLGCQRVIKTASRLQPRDRPTEGAARPACQSAPCQESGTPASTPSRLRETGYVLNDKSPSETPSISRCVTRPAAPSPDRGQSIPLPAVHACWRVCRQHPRSNHQSPSRSKPESPELPFGILAAWPTPRCFARPRVDFAGRAPSPR